MSGIEQAFAINEFGMTYERLRLEAASRNIANANTIAGPDGQVYRPLRVQANRFDGVSEFSKVLGNVNSRQNIHIIQQDSGAREVKDPNHPAANENGMVEHANINMVDEMAIIMSATRAYEANVRAFNAARGMTQKALEIGAR